MIRRLSRVAQEPGSRRTWRRFLSQFALGLCVGLALVVLSRAGFLEPLQLLWYDALLSVQDEPPPRYVKMVVVQEQDFHAWGISGLPEAFPRQMLAALVERLSQAGVGVLCIDLFLDHPSKPQADEALRRAFMAAAHRGTRVIVACDARGRALSVHPLFADLVRPACANLRLGPSHEVRWLDPVVRTASGALPSMAVLAFEELRGRLVARGLRPPTSPRRTVPIRFWPAGRSYGTYSARQIFTRRVESSEQPISEAVLKAWLKDAVVIIGRQDSGSQDVHWVPVHQGARGDGRRFVRMPGMEVQANCLATLLSHSSPRMGSPLVDSAIAVAAAALISFLLVWFGLGWGSVVSSVVVLLGGTWVSLRVFGSTGYVVNLAPIWVALLAQSYLTNRSEQKRLKQWLGAMVSDRVARSLGRTVEPVAGEGYTTFVVALNFDLRKSTQAAARLAPHEVGPLFNRILAVVCQAVLENGGIVNKFLGDGLLAIWLPRAGEEQAAAKAALQAAQAIPAAVDAVARIWEARLQEPFRYGIALHCGATWVGFVGTPRRLEFTALGSTVSDCYKVQNAAAETGQVLLATAEFLRVAGLLQMARLRPDWAQPATWRGLTYYALALEGVSPLPAQPVAEDQDRADEE